MPSVRLRVAVAAALAPTALALAVPAVASAGPSIAEIQGAAHLSALNGATVSDVRGVVTVKRPNGFYMQSAAPDADERTSEGIFVFGSSVAASVAVGDLVNVNGRVSEFRPGGAGGTTNLAATQITAFSTTSVVSSGNPLPASTAIGAGGRLPPTEVIEDDASGDVETSGNFDPAQDGIDFYESLEGMLVHVNGAVAVGPRNSFGEIAVVGDGGASAGVRTTRGGIVIRPGDFNPERVIVDDEFLRPLATTPSVNVSDTFASPLAGVMDYGFGNFKLQLTAVPVAVDGGLARETTAAPRDQEIAVATFNVENLSPLDPPAKFAELAGIIVGNLRSPDLIAVEEVQDNNGVVNDSVVDASLTWGTLIAAIQAAGGPIYEYRQIDPVDDADGGVPGANIRVGFLFRTDRGLKFVDRPGGDATTATGIVGTNQGPRLTLSPGRVDPNDPAWSTPEGVRKPLAGEFKARGKTLFVIANHWKSKSGDQPLFGRFQPPVFVTEEQRIAEAQVVNDFVDEILAVDPNANVIVLGDLNDFDFSTTVDVLEGGVMRTLMAFLPVEERYSYVFDGNSQVLDQIVFSNSMLERFPFAYDVVHVNSEFAVQSSDHEPQVARVDLTGRP